MSVPLFVCLEWECSSKNNILSETVVSIHALLVH